MPPWYPGTAQRYQGFVEAYPKAVSITPLPPSDVGDTGAGMGAPLPWLLVDVDMSNEGDYACHNEVPVPPHQLGLGLGLGLDPRLDPWLSLSLHGFWSAV